jgi:hypothetical protein
MIKGSHQRRLRVTAFEVFGNVIPWQSTSALLNAKASAWLT